MKTYEDLEPGDYLLFDGEPAQRGTALQGICVIYMNQMYFDVDPSRVEITDHLTIRELKVLPVGSIVSTGFGDTVIQTWGKVNVGKGQRWTSEGESLSAEDLAPWGARLVSKPPVLVVGPGYELVEFRPVSRSVSVVRFRGPDGTEWLGKINPA